jgi:hypothetical protein
VCTQQEPHKPLVSLYHMTDCSISALKTEPASNQIERPAWMQQLPAIREPYGSDMPAFDHTNDQNRSYPYVGGVPVVTMWGPFFGHRYGSAVVENAGFPELVADSKEEYLGIVTELVNNLQRLDLLSNSLRDSVAASPVCDSRSLTINIERACRKVWHSWCNKHPLG